MSIVTVALFALCASVLVSAEDVDLLALFALCASVLVSAEDVDLPEGVKTCKRDTDDYASCMRLAIQESWPTFIRGVPELDIPIMDPFLVDYHEGNYKLGAVTGKFITKNTMTYGLAQARFLSVKPQHKDDRFSLEIDFEMPKVLIEGDYKADGVVGSFKVGGKGKFNISMEDVRAMVVMEGPVVNDKWIIEYMSLTPEVGHMHIWASDLFYGNEELTKAALAFVNEYWPMLYHGMLPYAAETWNAHLRDFIGNIFSKLSFAKTFP